VFFIVCYARYRNYDKRHYHEKETPVSVSQMQAYDNFLQHYTKRSSRMLVQSNAGRVDGALGGKDLGIPGAILPGFDAVKSLIDK
jgi:hypothetical protein